MKKSARGSERLETFSQRAFFDRPNKPPLVNESWTKNAKDVIVKYSLAYIDFSLYAGDNGRVLGYDNAHGYHERHFMGKAEQIEFTTYAEQFERFISEVRQLREKS
jgi:hypothetical protein